MRITSKIVSLTIALTGISLGNQGMASAQDAAFDVGNVSVGYADGYVDRSHRFHVWEHRADAEQFRAKDGDQYRAWRHDDPRHHDDNKGN